MTARMNQARTVLVTGGTGLLGLGLCATARAFGLDESRIRPVPSSHFPDIAPRPLNTTLVTTRMECEVGVPPSNLEDGLREMAMQERFRQAATP